MKSIAPYKFAIGYILCVSFSAAIREMLMTEVSPALILLISSIIATIYFHAVNFGHITTIYKKSFEKKFLFFQLNLVVALMWLCTYYSIYNSSATIFVFEFFTTAGFCSVLSLREKNPVSGFWIVGFLVVILAPFFAYVHAWVGIFLGILAGLFGFIYNQVTYKIFSLFKLHASQTLALRFWILVCLLLAFVPSNAAMQLTIHNVLIIILLTFLTFILQIWLNGRSVIDIGGKETSFISSFTPLLTFMIQGMTSHIWFYYILLLSLFAPTYIAYSRFKRI